MTTEEPGRRLAFIPVTAIRANPDNPRGPEVRKHDLRFDDLVESVAAFGVLVPLVVRQVGPDQFELVDGERRLNAARSLRIAQVPTVIITAATTSDEVRRTMFQIHSNWSQWTAAMQCHALEGLYARLRAEFDEDWGRIADGIVSETGTDERTARNRLQFLKWPQDIKEAIYGRADSRIGNAYWYVVEIEDKIIEPALRNFPDYFDVVPVDEVRQMLFQKYREGLVRAAVQVRAAGVVARLVTDGARRGAALEIMDRLVRDVDYSFEEAREEYNEQFPETDKHPPPTPKSLLTLARRLIDTISLFSPVSLISAVGRSRADPEELATALNELSVVSDRLAQELEESESRTG